MIVRKVRLVVWEKPGGEIPVTPPENGEAARWRLSAMRSSRLGRPRPDRADWPVVPTDQPLFHLG